MNRKLFVSNAILWAAAILSSALAGAPAVYVTVLLPSLAAAAMLMNRPEARPERCRSAAAPPAIG